jgi:hypothetical protein
MCIDSWWLNVIMDRDRYPLLYIVELLDHLHGSRYFTKLELLSGYHDLHIHPDNCHKTAFITLDRLYQWRVIFFGFANSLTAFICMMLRILRPHSRYVVVCLDDILIYSYSRGFFVHNVEAILQGIQEVGLHLNGDKYEFGVLHTSIIGYYISADGIDMEAKKVEAISSWSVPQSVGELRSFLELAGYYRRFVKEFAHKSSHLHELVNDTVELKTVPFWWEQRYTEQFDGLKWVLSAAPVLATINPTKEFILRTDASDTAIGAVLAQR